MAVYDLEEQEQISQIKAWWEQYGNLVTTVIVSSSLILAAWQGLRWYEFKQANEAGLLYYQLQQALKEGDTSKARDRSGELVENYKGTAYAEMAALLSARANVVSDDLKNAQASLQWAVDHAKDPVFRDLARLRLAGVLLDQGEFKQGLSTLAGASAPELRARFDDLKGDLLAADGQIEEAERAYQAALKLFEKGQDNGTATGFAELVRLKLESLGV